MEIERETVAQFRQILRERLLARGVDSAVIDDAEFDTFIDPAWYKYRAETHVQIVQPD